MWALVVGDKQRAIRLNPSAAWPLAGEAVPHQGRPPQLAPSLGVVPDAPRVRLDATALTSLNVGELRLKRCEPRWQGFEPAHQPRNTARTAMAMRSASAIRRSARAVQREGSAASKDKACRSLAKCSRVRARAMCAGCGIASPDTIRAAAQSGRGLFNHDHHTVGQARKRIRCAQLLGTRAVRRYRQPVTLVAGCSSSVLLNWYITRTKLSSRHCHASLAAEQGHNDLSL